MMSDKISRILPPKLKRVEEEERERDLAEVIANSMANSIANEPTK
jgi:hypothetical protein